MAKVESLIARKQIRELPLEDRARYARYLGDIMAHNWFVADMYGTLDYLVRSVELIRMPSQTLIANAISNVGYFDEATEFSVDSGIKEIDEDPITKKGKIDLAHNVGSALLVEGKVIDVVDLGAIFERQKSLQGKNLT